MTQQIDFDGDIAYRFTVREVVEDKELPQGYCLGHRSYTQTVLAPTMRAALKKIRHTPDDWFGAVVTHCEAVI